MVVIVGGLDDSNSAQRRKEPESLSGATRKVERGASQRKRSNQERTDTEVVYRDLSFIPGRNGRIDPNSISTSFNRADIISNEEKHEVTNVTINLFASLFPNTFNGSTNLTPVEAATRFYNTVKIATGYTKAEILPHKEIKKLKAFIKDKAQAVKARGDHGTDSDAIKKELLVFSDYDQVLKHIGSALIKANSTPQALLFASQLLAKDAILETFDQSTKDVRNVNKAIRTLEELKKAVDDKNELYHAAKNLTAAHKELEEKKNWLKKIKANHRALDIADQSVLEEINTRIRTAQEEYNRLKELIKKNIGFFDMGYEGPVYPGAESAQIYDGVTDAIPRDSIEVDDFGTAKTDRIKLFSSVFSIMHEQSERINRLDLKPEGGNLSESEAEGYISLMVNKSEKRNQYWRDLQNAFLIMPQEELVRGLKELGFKADLEEALAELKAKNFNQIIKKQLVFNEIIEPLSTILNSAARDLRQRSNFDSVTGSIKALIEKLELITGRSYKESGFSAAPMGTKAFEAAYRGAERFGDNDPSQVGRAQIQDKRKEKDNERIAKERIKVYKDRLLKQSLSERVIELSEARKSTDFLAALENLYISDEGIRRNEGAAASPSALRKAMKNLGQRLRESSESDASRIDISKRIKTLKNIEDQSTHLMPIMFSSNPEEWLVKFYDYSKTNKAFPSPEQLEVISRDLEGRPPEQLKETEKRLLNLIRRVKLKEEKVGFLISRYLSKVEILQKLEEDPNFLGKTKEDRDDIIETARKRLEKSDQTDRILFLIDLQKGIKSTSSVLEKVNEQGRQARSLSAAKPKTEMSARIAEGRKEAPRAETKELDRKAKERPIAETKKPELIESSKGIEQRIDNQIKQLIARSIEIGGRTNSKGLGRGLNNDGTSSLKKDQYRKELEALSPEALTTLYLETSMKARLLAPILERDNNSIHSFAKFPRLAKFRAGYKATGISKRYQAHADFLAELMSANKAAISTVDSLINILEDYYMNHSNFDLHKKEIQDKIKASDGKTLEILDYAITFFNELIYKREEEITQNLLANNRTSYEEIKAYTSTGSGKEEARKHKALLEEMRNRELSPLFLALSQQFASLIKSSISGRI